MLLAIQSLLSCVGAMASQPQDVAVTCVQPIAIVDHIARLTEEELKQVVGDETGGSRRVERETINDMLQKAGKLFAQKKLCKVYPASASKLPCELSSGRARAHTPGNQSVPIRQTDCCRSQQDRHQAGGIISKHHPSVKRRVQGA